MGHWVDGRTHVDAQWKVCAVALSFLNWKFRLLHPACPRRVEGIAMNTFLSL
jgi:hypothetical protein